MKEHIYNLVMFDKMITDRTVLDGMVYTTDLYKQGKVSKETYNECNTITAAMIYKYDYLFYITPEFPIENDGVRSTSQEWQDRIVKEFNNLIKLNEVSVINVSGSVRERVNTILKAIGENYE